MLDKLKSLGIQALFVALIGGVAAFVLGMVMGPVQNFAYGSILAAIIALILGLYIEATTEAEKLGLFSFFLLFLVVGIVGSAITAVFPAAAPYIFTLGTGLTPMSIILAFVYVGLAMMAEDKIL